MGQFPELPTGAAGTGIVVLAILIGLLNCFFGYRIFKIVLGIWGFVLGVVIGAGIAWNVSGEVWIAVLAGLLVGLIGAALAVVAYFVGIFLLGAGLGAMVGFTVGSVFGESLQLILAIVLAIIGGVLAVILQKLMIILSTAFGGAGTVVASIFLLTAGRGAGPRRIDFPPTDTVTVPWYLLLIWLVLGILGVIIQYTVTAKKKPQPAPAAVPPAPAVPPPPVAPAVSAAPPTTEATKTCPYCLSTIPVQATRCAHCTAVQPPPT